MKYLKNGFEGGWVNCEVASHKDRGDCAVTPAGRHSNWMFRRSGTVWNPPYHHNPTTVFTHRTFLPNRQLYNEQIFPQSKQLAVRLQQQQSIHQSVDGSEIHNGVINVYDIYCKSKQLILYPYLSLSVGPYYATNLAFLTSRRMRTCRKPTQDSYNDIHQERICHIGELSQWIGKVKYLRWRYYSRECTSKVTGVQSIMLIAQEWVF